MLTLIAICMLLPQDVDSIIEAVESREAKTFPFAASYELEVSFDGVVWQELSITGTIVQGPRFRQLRVIQFGRDLKRGGLQRSEIIQLEEEDRVVDITRRLDPAVGAWRGRGQRRFWGSPDGPGELGFLFGTEKISTLLRRGKARIVGSEDGGIWVRASAFREATPAHHVTLLLDPARDYFPMEIIHYVPPSFGSDVMDEPMLQVEGQTFKARLRIVIDEILQVDGAWIPIKARKLNSSQGHEAVSHFRIDPSSIQIGKEPSLLGDVERVVVRDDDTGEKRVYGSAPLAPMLRMLRGVGYGLLCLVAVLFCRRLIHRVRRGRQLVGPS